MNKYILSLRNVFYNRYTFGLVAFILLFSFVFFRLSSLYWNSFYSHDNWLYGNAAESLALRGDTMVATTNEAYQFIPFHFYSIQEKGGEFLDHNPLWPILAAPFVWLFHINGSQATAILSFLSGCALLFLLFKVGEKIAGRTAGYWAFFFGGISYLLIDFSGNGSFYIFQACLYLLFILIFLKVKNIYQPLFLGVVAGLAVLIVHQSVALIAAYFVYLLLFERRNFFKNFTFFLLPVIILYLPWGLRNLFWLGSFFPPSDTYYVWSKIGVEPVQAGEDYYKYVIGLVDLKRLFLSEITFWLPRNIYFISRKLFILAPILFIGTLCLAGEAFFNKWWHRLSREQLKQVAPILLVLLFHILISAAWPIPKFRYFVSMVPLCILLGIYYAYFFVRSAFWHRVLAVSTIILFTILSLLTFFGSPSHTYYYGGLLTTDPYGNHGERAYIENYIPPVRDPAL